MAKLKKYLGNSSEPDFAVLLKSYYAMSSSYGWDSVLSLVMKDIKNGEKETSKKERRKL